MDHSTGLVFRRPQATLTADLWSIFAPPFSQILAGNGSASRQTPTNHGPACHQTSVLGTPRSGSRPPMNPGRKWGCCRRGFRSSPGRGPCPSGRAWDITVRLYPSYAAVTSRLRTYSCRQGTPLRVRNLCRFSSSAVARSENPAAPMISRSHCDTDAITLSTGGTVGVSESPGNRNGMNLAVIQRSSRPTLDWMTGARHMLRWPVFIE